MGSRAVHFALTDNQCRSLLEHRGTDLLSDALGQIEDARDEEWLCETEKSWELLRRCLADEGSKPNPLQLAVGAGEDLFNGEGGAADVARLVRSEDVAAVASALEAVTDTWLQKRFAGLVMSGYDGPTEEKDFAITWENVQALARFFRRAATNRRAVLFSVYL